MSSEITYKGRTLILSARTARVPVIVEGIPVDPTKHVRENIRDIIGATLSPNENNKAIRLAHLNNFVRIFSRNPDSFLQSCQLTLRQILIWVRCVLTNEEREIRAAALRVIRYLIRSPADVQLLVQLKVDMFMPRSIDIAIDNQIERLQYLRLMANLCDVVPDCIPASLIRPLIAIATDGADERDKLTKASVGLLCELTVKSPELVLSCGSLAWLTRAIVFSKQLQMTETLVAVLAHLCETPTLRLKTNVTCVLQEIVAPLSDPSFRLHSLIAEEGKPDTFSSMIKETDVDYLLSCRMAFTAVLRSFPLLLMSVRPMKSQGCSVLTAIVQTFYSNNVKLQETAAHLMLDTFCIPTETNCFSSWDSLVQFASRSMDNSTFGLAQGYLCDEVKAQVAPKMHERLDMIEQQLALCLLGLVDSGLIQGLVHTVMSALDESLQLKCIFLIGYLTVKSANWLPLCWSQNSFSSSLVRVTNQPDHNPWERHQALSVIYKIQQLLRLLSHEKSEPSLDLQFLLLRASHSAADPDRHTLDVGNSHWHDLIKRAKVLSSGSSWDLWDWDYIHSALLCVRKDHKLLSESTVIKFLQQLMLSCRPSADGLHKWDQKTDVCALAGVLFAENLCILSSQSHDPAVIGSVKEFFIEVSRFLCHKKTQVVVSNTKDPCCHSVQMYFFMIATFLEKSGNSLVAERSVICQSFFDAVSVKTEENFVKLLLATLDCRSSQIQQAIFTKLLVSTKEKCRRYATEFLRVVYRLFTGGDSSFSRWLLKATLGQLEDKSVMVVQSAVSVLEECLLDEEICELFVSIVAEEHSLVTLLRSVGDVGVLLLTRLFSVESALAEEWLESVLKTQLDLWETEFTLKYVHIMDEIIHEGLSEYKKTGNGSFMRRTNETKRLVHTNFPSHLYGQLAKHMRGSAILAKKNVISSATETLKSGTLKSDEDTLKMCAALLSLGHIGGHQWGFVRLPTFVVPSLVKVAEECPLLSVRRCAFYALSLIAQCTSGALVLGDLGWETSKLGSSVRLASHLGISCPHPSVERFSSGGNGVREEEETAKGGAGDLHLKPDCLYSQGSSESQTTAQSPSVSEFRMSLSTGGIETAPQSQPQSTRERHLSKSSDHITELCVYTGSALSVSSCSSCAMCRQMDPCESGVGSDCTDVTSTTSPFNRGRTKLLSNRRPIVRQTSLCLNRFSRVDCPIEVACVTEWPVTQSHLNSKSETGANQGGKMPTPGVTLDTPGSFEMTGDSYSDDYGSSLSLSPQLGLMTEQRQRAEEMRLFRHLMARRRMSLSPSHVRHQPFFGGKPFHRHFSMQEGDYLDGIKYRRSHNNTDMSTRWPQTLMEETQQEATINGDPDSFASNQFWLSRGDPTLCGITSLQKLSSHRSVRLRKLIALRHEPALPIATSLPAGYAIPEHPVTILQHLGDEGHAGYIRWRKLLRDAHRDRNSLLLAESPLEEELTVGPLRSPTEKDENGNGVALAPEQSDLISRARKGSIFAASGPSVNRILNTSMSVSEDTLDSSRGDPSFWYELISSEQADRSITCLPVDINMLTAVDEAFEQSRVENENNFGWTIAGSFLGQLETFGLPAEHESHTCLSCQANVEDMMESDSLRANLILNSTDATDLTFDSDKVEVGKGDMRVVEESNIGRSLVRKEILRLITVLSARKKHAETGLLRLKQEYPACFKDLCIYSDVAYLLSLYNFRLSSRSFLQELFQDCDFTKLFDAASNLFASATNTSVSSPSAEAD